MNRTTVAVKKPARWADAVPAREAQFETKRRALVREAARAFGRRGFHNTSLEEIAEALGVTKPALYRYVRTKHEILHEAKSIAFDSGAKAREMAFAASEDPIERLRLYIIHYIDLVTSELGSYAVLAEPVTSLPPEYADPIRARMREADRALRDMVQSAMDAGFIPAGDPKLSVAFFMGAINHIARWYTPDGPLTGREIGEIFAGFVLNGLRGPGPQPT
ncbi:TetR/AcrR family transcriptional regulator [Roseomonas xinghualingensis]|uniref:TetR/AcrR family transcriptional regulator n=1 Tax=Roseomonas xinghualingensis TaxID=2986475 RepID=UPI0021F24C15|nr:TetR/AcrR family transcriptional regulator [Roseomonas sp. SXEYE001]MCV4209688.1 TetR/AcrR family transcriptional regulator [Roseomonas sp. SXEYE001]